MVSEAASAADETKGDRKKLFRYGKLLFHAQKLIDQSAASSRGGWE
jgi:hypothetical protein